MKPKVIDRKCGKTVCRCGEKATGVLPKTEQEILDYIRTHIPPVCPHIKDPEVLVKPFEALMVNRMDVFETYLLNNFPGLTQERFQHIFAETMISFISSVQDRMIERC